MDLVLESLAFPRDVQEERDQFFLGNDCHLVAQSHTRLQVAQPLEPPVSQPLCFLNECPRASRIKPVLRPLSARVMLEGVKFALIRSSFALADALTLGIHPLTGVQVHGKTIFVFKVIVPRIGNDR